MVQEQDELMKVRLLYIGSAVPLDSADGLDGVQKPLADRYPTDNDAKLEGILSYVSIIRDGINLQYVSDLSRILFFPISSLKLCAAVRCVTRVDPATEQKTSRFVSLSDPEARGANSQRPAIFTFITRRSEGRKVLECHAFVCSSDKDALDLVTCTSSVSRQYKEKTNGVSPGFETTRSASASTSTVGHAAATAVDHPIRLVAGSDSASCRVAPEFYEPPPQHGYFYKTVDSQVKSYTIERVVEEGGSERLRAISSNAPVTLPCGPASEKKLVQGGPPPGFVTLPPPQGRHQIPVRVVPPQAVHGRPRFFSPPPPMLRPVPMAVPPRYMMGPQPYVLVPPPGPYMEPPFVLMEKPPRRKGSHSSRGSSGSSSPGSPRQMNGQEAVNGTAADGSIEAGSRPHTPPTDYEKGPRVSRREKFEHSQRHFRQANVDPVLFAGPTPHTPHPFGMYMMYPPHYLGYPPHMMERARSVPPTLNRGPHKEGKKSGKSKKEKKKKSGKHRHHGAPSDVSTDSMGYTSEIGPAGDYPRMPRDFRLFQNQFKHERAFSKSLKEEGSRGAPQAQNPGNAYSLNEHMSKKGRESDFNLY